MKNLMGKMNWIFRFELAIKVTDWILGILDWKTINKIIKRIGLIKMDKNNNDVHVIFEVDFSSPFKIEEELIKAVGNDGYEFYYGCLIDNYLFYTEGLDIEIFYDCPASKYIILKEKYFNGWESIYQVTITDDDSLAREFEDEAMEYWDRKDKEDGLY